jgi:mannosyltransferase
MPREPKPRTATRHSLKPGWLAVTFAVAAAVLSAAGSWIPSFWGDEAASLLSAQRPLSSLFTMLGHVDAVHGSYYLFLHFWIDAFGASPLSVRLPSALAIGAAVAGAVVLAGRLAGTRVAVYTGVVAMLLPRLTSAGTETRAYAFSAALAIWLTVLLAQLVARRRPGRGWNRGWAGYAVLVAASAYLFLFSLLIPLAHALALAWAPATRRMLRAWLIATAGGVVLAAPVVVWGVAQRNQISFLNRRDEATWDTILVGQWFGNSVYAALVGVLLAVTVVGALRRRRARRRTAPRVTSPKAVRLNLLVLAGAVAVVPPAVLLTVNIVNAVYTNRYLAMTAPAAAVAIGYLLTRLPRGWGVVGLLALTVAAAPTYLAQRTPFAKNDSDWSQVAGIIGSHATAGDAVVFDESTRPSLRLRLAMHTYPSAFAGLNDITLNRPYAQNPWWSDTTYKVRTVAGRFSGVDRVWLFEYHPAGQEPDSYGLADLRALGFDVAASYPAHRSVVYELTRVG